MRRILLMGRVVLFLMAYKKKPTQKVYIYLNRHVKKNPKRLKNL